VGRIYTIRIRRSDREYVDPVRIRAESRYEAEACAHEIFGDRLVSIVRRSNSVVETRPKQQPDDNKD
jgi:hypothetical protein